MRKTNLLIVVVVILFSLLSFALASFTYNQLHRLQELSDQYEENIQSQDIKIGELETKLINYDQLLKSIESNYEQEDKNILSKVKALDAAISSKSKRWEKKCLQLYLNS